MDTATALLPSLLSVLILAVIALVVLTAFGVPRPWAPVVAIARGTAQLAIISLILTGVISNPVWIAVALVTMFVVASTVAARRVGFSARSLAMTTTTIAAGASTALVTVFVTGALDFTPRYVLAISAIIIGNTMGVATLTGRLFTNSVIDHWDEVEGWLALGATPRQATRSLARRTVRDALIPSVDQTKTTGLVVLPGAFVGAIFGGVSPLEAGRFQIVVLSAIMAAGAIAAVLIATWLGDVRTRPNRAS